MSMIRRDNVVDRILRSPLASEPSVLVSTPAGETLFQMGRTSRPVLGAETTKLTTTALVLREIDRGTLTLDSVVNDLLPRESTEGLVVTRGRDWANSITVEHLLRHVSGIPDYFTAPGRGDTSLFHQVLERDQKFSPDDAYRIAKQFTGHHPPGVTRRARTSFTAYRLLGDVLRATTGMTLPQLIDLRIRPLGTLGDTLYVPNTTPSEWNLIAPLKMGQTSITLPLAFRSFGADAGLTQSPLDLHATLALFRNASMFHPDWVGRLWEKTTRLDRHGAAGLGVLVHRGPRLKGSSHRLHFVGMWSFTGVATLWETTHDVFVTVALNQLQDSGTARELAVDLTASLIRSGVLVPPDQREKLPLRMPQYVPPPNWNTLVSARKH